MRAKAAATAAVVVVAVKGTALMDKSEVFLTFNFFYSLNYLSNLLIMH